MTAQLATTRLDRAAVSADGSKIAYTRLGAGPVVILVAGAFVHRGFGTMHKIADHLIDAFTVVTYDRRDRGESRQAPTTTKSHKSSRTSRL